MTFNRLISFRAWKKFAETGRTSDTGMVGHDYPPVFLSPQQKGKVACPEFFIGFMQELACDQGVVFTYQFDMNDIKVKFSHGGGIGEIFPVLGLKLFPSVDNPAAGDQAEGV